tara:strand:+ start:231 stop:422 length:192 start_codon:yes stop_codon:yes gene_type:complete
MESKPPIPVNTPIFNGNEKKYLNECIDTGWISSEGPFVLHITKLLREVIRRKKLNTILAIFFS